MKGQKEWGKRKVKEKVLDQLSLPTREKLDVHPQHGPMEESVNVKEV